MALTGTYSRNLDDKHRLALPKRLCDEFGEADLKSFYVAPGTQKSLCLYSPAGFDRLARRVSRKSKSRAETLSYVRLFYSRAEKVELDAQGRIRIPDRLVEFAGLSRDVMLLGVHDHAEVWDAVAWQKFLSETSAAFDDMALQAFSD